ncbi:MAG: hypothetical protein DMG78_33000 [Acidobacteria bacterium]|nr:MAG: hypothetical protein DMG78_33000 [Acidobacteriota bacterium]
MNPRRATSQITLVRTNLGGLDLKAGFDNLAQITVTILRISSIHAFPWVVICAAKSLDLLVPTRLLTGEFEILVCSNLIRAIQPCSQFSSLIVGRER